MHYNKNHFLLSFMLKNQTQYIDERHFFNFKNAVYRTA